MPNISRWASGERKPGDAMRVLIQATWPAEAPAPEEWDQPLPAFGAPLDTSVDDDDPADDDDEPPARATPQAVEGEADEWLRDLRAARREAALVTDVGDRLRLLESGARTLLTLGKMTGAGLDLTEARILASPQWRRIEAMLTVALEPWPEAMLAASEALKKLAGVTGPVETGRTE